MNKTKKEFKNFILYAIVGGIATLSEWIIFFFLDELFSIHYIVATVIAYVISTFVNWLAGRLILFKSTEKGVVLEIISIYLTSIIGLLLNMLIMWGAVEKIGINEMISKIAATVIVFGWNYVIRKVVIYKEQI